MGSAMAFGVDSGAGGHSRRVGGAIDLMNVMQCAVCSAVCLCSPQAVLADPRVLCWFSENLRMPSEEEKEGASGDDGAPDAPPTAAVGCGAAAAAASKSISPAPAAAPAAALAPRKTIRPLPLGMVSPDLPLLLCDDEGGLDSDDDRIDSHGARATGGKGGSANLARGGDHGGNEEANTRGSGGFWPISGHEDYWTQSLWERTRAPSFRLAPEDRIPKVRTKLMPLAAQHRNSRDIPPVSRERKVIQPPMPLSNAPGLVCGWNKCSTPCVCAGGRVLCVTLKQVLACWRCHHSARGLNGDDGAERRRAKDIFGRAPA